MPAIGGKPAVKLDPHVIKLLLKSNSGEKSCYGCNR
jgi:hypothetical protein